MAEKRETTTRPQQLDMTHDDQQLQNMPLIV